MQCGSSLDDKLLSWDEIKDRGYDGILIGNGASRAISEGFGYKSLFEVAKRVGLTTEDVRLFSALSTENFEQVLAAVAIAKQVNRVLGLSTEAIEKRYDSIRGSLFSAVRSVHVPWQMVSDRLEFIHSELRNYKSIYSTNYDLILYWSIMKRADHFADYFWSEGNSFSSDDVRVSASRIPVHYIHGALHLYRTIDGRTKKRLWKGDSILDNLQAEDDEAAPLFVSEGVFEDKISVIRQSDYLNFSYDRLKRHEGSLCIFGHGLSDSDQHIVAALQDVDEAVAVSIFPDGLSAVKQKKADILKKLPGPEINFFDATTHPLGQRALREG